MAGYINSKRAPHYFVKEQNRYLFLGGKEKEGCIYVCARFWNKIIPFNESDDLFCTAIIVPDRY